MLSFDFADTAIIDTIAIARIITAIVPNSGTTLDGIIISKGEGIVTVVCKSE